MALIDEVKQILIRLWNAEDEWRVIFSKHGFNLSKNDLLSMDANTLTKHLLDDTLHIDRNQPGFEDFSNAGHHMIQPGIPSQSLLYHALASPNIYHHAESQKILAAFPTLFELDTIENFIYAKQNFDLEKWIQQEGIEKLAIGVFSYEYRQGINTTHHKYADMCFSRTGVCRVGTHPHHYETDLRAFTPFLANENENGMRVLPAKYATFIAVRRAIKDPELSVLPYLGREGEMSDKIKKREFWVPVHKLFEGSECLKNHNAIQISYSLYHENTKLKKVCEYIKQTQGRDLDNKPYTITDDLIETIHFSDDTHQRAASFWIMPLPHPLVEVAKDEHGKRVTIAVPPDPQNRVFAALTLESDNGARSAPEYVNVRHKLESDGSVTDLNQQKDVSTIVANGNYDALMHVDYTADGWILAKCEGLPLQSLPAYSLITAPDFIPFAEQRELIEWGHTFKASRNYWALEPWALSDSRILPNIKLKNSPFTTNVKDKTIQTLTALVGPLTAKKTIANQNINRTISRRSSFLPDAAAGEFQPGWDVTWDFSENNEAHLSAYGLGSPFLEDAKLCAALSTFWPAAAPDIARSYILGTWPSVCPLTDEEIGQIGNSAWDGIPGPKRVQRHGKDWVSLPDFNHVDYVTQGLAGKFNMYTIGQIDIDEYKNRIDALWQVYENLNALEEKNRWRVLSFRKILNTDPTLIENIGQTAANKMQGIIFAITIYFRGEIEPSDDSAQRFEEITRENKFYVDSSKTRKIWRQKQNTAWNKVTHTETVEM